MRSPAIAAAGLCLVLALGGACRTVGVGGSGREAVGVSAALRLDGPEDGALEVALTLGAGGEAPRLVEWALALDGQRVAVGEEAPTVTALPDGRRRAAFTTPLVFRGLPWRPGNAWVQVQVRGVLHEGRDERIFATSFEALVGGRPGVQRGFE